MRFQNRQDAGRKLAAPLMRFKPEKPVILALPRGGVPVAAEIAAALEAPLDLVLVRKIGVPLQPEWAMGAVVDGGAPLVVRNEDVIRRAGVRDLEFESICDKELRELERRRRHYVGGRKPLDIAGRTAIVVDDGLATGATTRAALRATRKRGPKTLILAVPVGPSEAVAEMRQEADEVVCLDVREDFGALGFHYADFGQVGDLEVTEALQRFQAREPEVVEQPRVRAWRCA